MTKITCDRRGKPIARYPWMQTKYPIITIVCVSCAQDTPHSIDLCDSCTEDFQKWVNDNETQSRQEEMNK